MNKIPFKYQRWFLRNTCFSVILFFASLALCALEILTEIPIIILPSSMLAIIICILTERFYFKHTKHSKWFICEGNYWVEDGTVFIETRKKTYSIDNVICIIGKTVSFDRYNKSGKLTIDYNNKTLKLISTEDEKVESFSDSGLYGLFETIIENNPELKKDNKLHFWYSI